MGRFRVPAVDRFWRHVARGDKDECWPWLGRVEPNGYARFRPDPDLTQPRRGAHVYAYELEHGPVPTGMTVDHLCHVASDCPGGMTCRHRRCVNPAHLGLASRRDNVLRGNGPAAKNAAKTRCKRGHPLAGEGSDVLINAQGARVCRICRSLMTPPSRRPVAAG